MWRRACQCRYCRSSFSLSTTFHYVCPRDRTEVARLGGKRLYLLSHLVDPWFLFLFAEPNIENQGHMPDCDMAHNALRD